MNINICVTFYAASKGPFEVVMFWLSVVHGSHRKEQYLSLLTTSQSKSVFKSGRSITRRHNNKHFVFLTGEFKTSPMKTMSHPRNGIDTRKLEQV